MTIPLAYDLTSTEAAGRVLGRDSSMRSFFALLELSPIPPVRNDERKSVSPGDICARLPWLSSSIVVSTASSLGGLLGGNPNDRPLEAAGFGDSFRRDWKEPEGDFEVCPGCKNSDFEADGGGPIGVVDGMGSFSRGRSGVEGGSESEYSGIA